jgi:TRAP-type C4-dicarboxylate transport system permease small subunit
MAIWISKIDKKMAELLDNFCIVCLVIVMILILISVFTRMTGLFTIDWLEEIIFMAIAWMIFVKTALIFRKNDHLEIGFLSDLLLKNKKARGIYNMVIYAVTLITLLVFGSASFILCCTTRRNSDVLDISYKYLYFSLFFSLFLSSLYIVASLIKEFKE